MEGERPLGQVIRPCGPIMDPGAAERARALLDGAGLSLDIAWPVLAPVFGAAPYLASLSTRDPDRLVRILSRPAGQSLEAILAATRACAAEPDIERAAARLRGLKADLHLLVALADLGGAWNLTEVTGALSRFADAAVRAALTQA
ncbi:MAG: bifunctional [glutamine synthetase] adenylyltransferase/[glutamine synthetase]-adenylyl-L-tyrosine phosphorylase, partial [Caulobacteraceae bacterium]